jgi:transposase
MQLLDSGLGLSETAERVGATVTSVFRWRQARRAGGDTALASKPVPGQSKKLSASERKRLLEILLKGAVAWGFPNELWTLNRIGRVILKEFGVDYHPGHIWKVLKKAGWICQIPERRAVQRDEDKIAHWKRYKWPTIKKNCRPWRPPRLSG